MNRSQRRAFKKQKQSAQFIPAGFFYDDKTVNRMIRSACSSCGSAHITWHAAEELPMVVPPNLEPEAVDLLENLADDAPASEAWMCRDCFHFGVMSTAQAF